MCRFQLPPFCVHDTHNSKNICRRADFSTNTSCVSSPPAEAPIHAAGLHLVQRIAAFTSCVSLPSPCADLASLYIELKRLINTYAVGFLPLAQCSLYNSILRATESHALTFCACAGVTVVGCRKPMQAPSDQQLTDGGGVGRGRAGTSGDNLGVAGIREPNVMQQC